MRIVLSILAVILLALHCAPTEHVQAIKPDVLVVTDDDSLRCRILHGELLTMQIQTEDGDTIGIDNSTVNKIVHLSSGKDITSRYIDREAIRVEIARQRALERREKLRTDAMTGLKRSADLKRTPVALLSARFLGGKPPRVQLAVLNLGNKRIELIKVRVRCFDASGKPQGGLGGRDHIFQATSRIPLEPEEDLTTILALHKHPNARKVQVEIHYLEFADKTWWKGEVTATAE
jgi:hypothetical protein